VVNAALPEEPENCTAFLSAVDLMQGGTPAFFQMIQRRKIKTSG
jgi:hypothetical protein